MATFEFVSDWLLPIAYQGGLFMMYGASFLLMSRSGFVNLGMSFQMTFAPIVSLWAGWLVGREMGPAWAATSALTTCLAVTLMAGVMMVLVRCRFNVSDVFATFTFGLISGPLSTLVFSLLPAVAPGQTVGTPNRIPGPVWWLPERPWTIIFLGASASLFASWWIEQSRWGYQGRAFANNPELLDYERGRRVLIRAMVASSAILGVAVFFDTYVRYGRYQASLYDAMGFLGVVVGLLADKLRDRISAVSRTVRATSRVLPLSTAGARLWLSLMAGGLFLAFMHTLFNRAAGELGFPAYSFSIILGLVIVQAAWQHGSRAP